MVPSNCTNTATSTIMMNDTTNVNNVSCIMLELSGPTDHDSLKDVVTHLSPLISDEIRLQLEIVLQISLFTVTSLFGTVANIINITVYWKQGLRDSITVGLFALSVSDFFVVFFPLFTSGCYMADHLFPGSPVMYKAVAGVSATQARHLVYSLSCTLTAFLSIERCFCVVRPFKVKLIFTRTRTIIIVLSMVAFYIMAFIPMFATHQLRWQKDPRRNFTDVFTLWYHPAAQYVIPYNSSLMSITIPTAAQVIVTCTAIIMISGLRKASKFRRSATETTGNTAAGVSNSRSTKLVTAEIESKSKSTATASEIEIPANGKNYVSVGRIGEGLDSRDARLVKTMLILVVILSCANIPYICLKYTQLIVPEMNPRKRYQNTFRLMSSINFLLGSLNATVNAVVYYYTGSRYREVFHSIFCRKANNKAIE